jgi:hypothetical protein
MSELIPKTVHRALTLPVAAPVKLSWSELDAAINPAFRLATEIANWCVRRLFVLDDPFSTKAPPAVQQWNGYKDANANYPRRSEWDGATGSMAAVVRAAHRKYLDLRWHAVYRCDSSLLTYRFPQPYVIREQEWRNGLEWETGASPVLSVPLPGIGRVSLRLRAGPEFGRQLAMLRQILDGSADRGTVSLLRNRKGALHAKIVGTFPAREQLAESPNACFLHTDPAALLVAEVNGRAANMTNGDHIRRAVAAHKAILQRASEDKKRELRMDRQQRKNFDAAIDRRCGKQRDRVDTAIHQVTAQVVRFCERQRVGIVVYDDADTAFIPEGFPWFTVRERLTDKLRAVGITLLAQGRDITPEEFQAWRSNPTLAAATALAGRRLVATINRKGPHPSVSVAPVKKSSRTARTCRTPRSVKSSGSAATSPSVPPVPPGPSSGASAPLSAP